MQKCLYFSKGTNLYVINKWELVSKELNNFKKERERERLKLLEKYNDRLDSYVNYLVL